MVLGIITTIDMLTKNQVRLRVRPRLAWMTSSGMTLVRDSPVPIDHRLTNGAPPTHLAIEIVNLSGFPVTVSDVGLGKYRSGTRCSFTVPLRSDGYGWPAVIESRRALSVYQEMDQFRTAQAIPKVAYVKTQCDEVRYGRSDALEWLCATITEGGHAASERDFGD